MKHQIDASTVIKYIGKAVRIFHRLSNGQVCMMDIDTYYSDSDMEFNVAIIVANSSKACWKWACSSRDAKWADLQSTGTAGMEAMAWVKETFTRICNGEIPQLVGKLLYITGTDTRRWNVYRKYILNKLPQNIKDASVFAEDHAWIQVLNNQE